MWGNCGWSQVAFDAENEVVTRHSGLTDRISVEKNCSIVIPAYNEENRIDATLERTLAFFAERPDWQWEVLVVDDGSTDRTAALIAARQAQSQNIRLLSHERNMGKGWAVRTGMLAAGGEYVLFMDADGSTDIAELENLVEAVNQGADVAIGSRALAGSEIRKRQPVVRESMGKAFTLLVRILAVPSVSDATCGFKLFRRPVIDSLFGRQTLRGWVFDVEILYLAEKSGFQVTEVPVHWTDFPDSRVNLAGVVLPSLWDLLRIRFVHRAVARNTASNRTG